jgi:predicted AlkP superfamily pyrophosphatase or phosphodiesterase
MRQLSEFYDLMKEARKDELLLVCYLDGFGYYMYEEALKMGVCPFIESNFTIEPLLTVTPPVTNPSMATMITGVLPEIHGVHSRKERRLKVPSIFSQNMGKVAFIEGDSVILKTEIMPSLHPGDENHNSDYYVYQATVEAIKEENEFIFAHFHGIDDCAHDFGPYHKNTFETIRQVDTYLQEICSLFQGKVLLVSDHGIHTDGTHGEHGVPVNGEFVKEDMTALLGVKRR